MQNEKKAKEYVLEDATMVAFLHLKGFEITPFKKSTDRVAFIIKGNIEPALSALYENEFVGVLDFIKSLKTIRGSIYTFKNLDSKGTQR